MMSAKKSDFFTPSPLSAFRFDLYYKIHSTSLSICLLLHDSSPSNTDIISGCPPDGPLVGRIFNKFVRFLITLYMCQEIHLTNMSDIFLNPPPPSTLRSSKGRIIARRAGGLNGRYVTATAAAAGGPVAQTQRTRVIVFPRDAYIAHLAFFPSWVVRKVTQERRASWAIDYFC